MKIDFIGNLIETALGEDIGPGDITTDHLVNQNQQGRGEILAKEPLIIAGIDVARQVFKRLDSDIEFIADCNDGDEITAGQVVITISGRLNALLTGERTALNFLQRMSGIATNTRSYLSLIKGKNVRLVDTRKTTPGWRILEKYAVRAGGAQNHRMGLYDGVLIKDNHIAVSGSIKEAVAKIRSKVSHLSKIEVEADSLAQVEQALDAGADVIMLDNMNPEQIKEAVKLIDGRALVEVSGNVNKKTLEILADLNVDIISAGALTHAARSMDLSMRIFPE
ncbi:carboxylating nicotinate-nucleotide diphosphorylase [Desulfobacterales bacterium HSG16]|nr:carboxylating nicotinate-nucleotide diphosphorylase [Desulfobacterales bacterium HSG16]